jgi:L-lactate dehydrogenase complex protein LldG
MSEARDAILSTIERSRNGRATRPVIPSLMLPANDLAGLFEAKAEAEGSELLHMKAFEQAPGYIARALRRVGAPPRLHIPAASALRALPWADRVPDLALIDEPPGGEDAAVSAADYAIAETGTVVFFSTREQPASWHFLPGREFILVSRAQVLPTLEDVLALAKKQGMPSTVNLVTGPSRTGDIEQTIEIGAHGPKHVHILMCD